MNRWVILSLLLWPLAAAAVVEKLEFVTPMQTVAPDAISEKITVQAQTAAGALQKLNGTADLSLISSSPTGEFSSSATNWESVDKLTMASGTANRNFYYRDLTAGSHTLTVTVTGRGSGWSVTARQAITVGQAASEPPPNPNPEPESPPPVIESPPPPLVINNQLPLSIVSPATSTMLGRATTTAPAILASVPAAVVAPVVPSAPAAPAYAAELARLSSELALAAAKLQTAQKGEQREMKAVEPKTPKVAHDNLAAAAVIEIPKPPSFFERLIAIPRRIWSAISSLFRRR